MIKNVIKSIKYGQGDGTSSGLEYARKFANEHEKKTGNKCLIEKVIDWTDRSDGVIREHISFYVIEIINE